MKILVTGSRKLPESERGVVWSEIMAVTPMSEKSVEHEIIVGDCPTGVDKYVAHFVELAKQFNEDGPALLKFTEKYNIKVFNADWAKHGKAAGPIRNQAMVDYGADVCLAFEYGESRGTKDCASRARKAGIPVKTFVMLTPSEGREKR